jgi:hypothetical protein
MLNRKYTILAGAVLAASPLVGKAVTMSFTYDANDISFAASATPGSGVGTFNSVTDTMTVTPGTIIDIGVDVDVTNNPNSPNAYQGVYDSTAGAHHDLQPANLGIAAFGIGFATSSQSVAPFDAGQDAGNITVNSNFSQAIGQGSLDPSNNILIGSISGGNGVSTAVVSTAAGVAPLSYGAGSPAELFNSVQIDAGVAGTATITATGIADNNFSYVAYNSGGTSSSSKPVYKAVAMGATDTLNQLPALTVIVGGAPVGHPIVSLTSAQPTAYGSEVGTLTLTGKGNGSYNVATLAVNPAQTTGYVGVSGFSPATDQEVYALKLGGSASTFGDAAIVTAINASLPVGVTASLVAGSAYASDFPGYDILLSTPTTSTVSSPDFLGFDFSQDSTQSGITVTGVAAVPEPATAAGIVLGAAGLLLGRRRNKLVVA